MSDRPEDAPPPPSDEDTAAGDASGGDDFQANPGNPVFTSSMKTSDLYATGSGLPKRFENPDMVKGYGETQRAQNPLYMTSNSSYGAVAPNVHTAPTRYHGKSQAFSKHLGQAGMYRNHSLNTAVDRSNVHAALDSHGAH